MASFIYNIAKQRLGTGDLDLEVEDLRIALVMADTTADTENAGITYVADFTNLDECDSVNYTRLALGSRSLVRNDEEDRSELQAEDVTWPTLNAASRNIIGVLLLAHDTDDDASIPVAWIEFATPKIPDGSTFTLEWSPHGIIQVV